MRVGKFMVCVALFGVCAGSALAARWDNYAPSKEAWNVTMLHVQPDKIDAYLNGLRTVWLPAVELAKKQGRLVDYKILVNKDAGTAGANVIIIEENTSWAEAAPNRARDLAFRAELQKAIPAQKRQIEVEDFDKYRQFVGEGDYWAVQYIK
jgi:hypothetical protein